MYTYMYIENSRSFIRNASLLNVWAPIPSVAKRGLSHPTTTTNNNNNNNNNTHHNTNNNNNNNDNDNMIHCQR